MIETRIDRRFAALKAEGRAAFVTYVMAGDPGYKASLDILKGLPAAGADIIEVGLPFTDPMADGPAIQQAGLRALAAGATLKSTLRLISEFREGDAETPVVMMGYYNPIYSYGVDRFLVDANAAGVDGLIVVDLPSEEDSELCLPALAAGINFIRLATPTTDAARLPKVLANSSGFLYYVSIAGTTGAAAPKPEDVAKALTRIRKTTDLPIAVGFGLRNGSQAAEIAKIAEGAVVGTALVEQVALGCDDNDAVKRVLTLVAEISDGIRSVRK